MGLPQIRSVAELRLRELNHPIPSYPIKGEPPKGPERLHPIEIQTRVEKLLDQGLDGPAQELLITGLERYPNDPDLLQSQQLIDAYRNSSATMSTSSLSVPHEP